jgi:hypothetical protein
MQMPVLADEGAVWRSENVPVNSALTGLLHIPYGAGDSENTLAFDLNLDIIAVVYK